MMRRLLHLIVDHWIAKLVAIILAFGLWAFVVNTGFRQGVLPQAIPVSARDMASGLAIASELPTVQVELYAPTAAFQRVKAEDVQAFINLAGLGVGEHTLEIKVFADDPNVRVLNVSPSIATVRLEKVRSKEFSVKLETEGDLGQGYVGDKAELEPDTITVRGATSRIDSIDQVVVRLALNGETSTVERSLTPQALDADRAVLSELTFEPNEITVTLPVIQAEDAKKVSVEVETTGDPAEGFFVGTISSDPNSITVQGSSKVLEDITVLKTEPIKLDNLSESIERTVKLVLPTNVRAEPSSVTVTIEIKAGTLTQDFSVTPEVFNLAAGTSASTTPNTISVTLTGPANLVRAVESAGLHLRIDANQRSTGEYTITLSHDQLGIDSQLRASFAPNSLTLQIQ